MAQISEALTVTSHTATPASCVILLADNKPGQQTDFGRSSPASAELAGGLGRR